MRDTDTKDIKSGFFMAVGASIFYGTLALVGLIFKAVGSGK